MQLVVEPATLVWCDYVHFAAKILCRVEVRVLTGWMFPCLHNICSHFQYYVWGRKPAPFGSYDRSIRKYLWRFGCTSWNRIFQITFQISSMLLRVPKQLTQSKMHSIGSFKEYLNDNVSDSFELVPYWNWRFIRICKVHKYIFECFIHYNKRDIHSWILLGSPNAYVCPRDCLLHTASLISFDVD